MTSRRFCCASWPSGNRRGPARATCGIPRPFKADRLPGRRARPLREPTFDVYLQAVEERREDKPRELVTNEYGMNGNRPAACRQRAYRTKTSAAANP